MRYLTAIDTNVYVLFCFSVNSLRLTNKQINKLGIIKSITDVEV